MSRKQRTIATFAVTIQMPDGFNLADMQKFIRAAITSYSANVEQEFRITDDMFTAALTKKVTTYGND